MGSGNTGSKLFSSLSSSVGKFTGQTSSSIGGYQASSPNTTEILQTVHAEAKHYTDRDVENKLKMLVCSEAKFDEMIEFGFPLHLSRADLEQIGVVEDQDEDEIKLQEHLDQHKEMERQLERQRQLKQKGGMFSQDAAEFVKVNPHMATNPASHWEKQFESLEQIRGSMDVGLVLGTRGGTSDYGEVDSSGKSQHHSLVSGTSGRPPQRGQHQHHHPQYSHQRTISSPISAVPREMTLKFTLTPASMRADEAILYGWQSSMNTPSQSTTASHAEEDYESGPATPGVHSSSGGGVSNTGGDVVLTGEPGSSSSAIPAGGLGNDGGSSKAIMKRVFSKLVKKEKKMHSSGSVMITSSDREIPSSGSRKDSGQHRR